MKTFDRKLLGGYGFVRPSRDGSIYGRVPSAIWKSVGECEIDSDREKESALTLFCFLRSKPPQHQCDAKRVYRDLRDLGCKIGKRRLERALSLLNHLGWIRYAEIILPNQQKAGSLIEVQFEQLPVSLRAKARKIVVHGDFEFFHVEEADGSKVPMDTIRPVHFEQSRASGIPPSKTAPLKSEGADPSPEHQEPEARNRQDHYNTHSVEPHQLEQPLNPLSEKGDQTIVSGVNGDATSEKTEVCAQDSSTREKEYARVVCQLGELGAKGDSGRLEYNQFLLEEVLPRIGDEELPERNSRGDVARFCQQSMKAHLLRSISGESCWSPDLARSFCKQVGKFPDEKVKRLFLILDWKRINGWSLREVVHGKASKSGGQGLNELLHAFADSGKAQRMGMSFRLESVERPSAGDETEVRDWWEAFVRVQGGMRFCLDDSKPSEKFSFLMRGYAIGSRYEGFCNGQDTPHDLPKKRQKWSEAIEHLIVSDRKHAAIASAFWHIAPQIWGIDFGRAKQRHLEYIQLLNCSADLWEMKHAESFEEILTNPIPAYPKLLA